jgi:formylglycine-generating enzyme required for sulfatase activity
MARGTSGATSRPPAEQPRANHWQGVFPIQDEAQDGYKAQSAPVGCFPANRYGLHDLSGNVWEWTRDPHPGSGPGQTATHLIKGGSFLCAENYCLRYRPAARQGGPPDTGSSHIGFRTVRRETGSTLGGSGSDAATHRVE